MVEARTKTGTGMVVFSQYSKEKQLNVETLVWGEVTWVNIEQPTRQETQYLAQHFPFHPFDLEDCLSRIQRPKIDEYEEYAFIVLHFPMWNQETKVTTATQLSIFVGKNYVVTIQAGELRRLSRLFEECKTNELARQENMGQGSIFLLYRILDILVDRCFPILDKILAWMETVEDAVFDVKIDASQELASLRRDVIAQRRLIWPLRSVIGSLETKLQKYAIMDMGVYFGNIVDHLNKVWDTLEEAKEMVEVYKDSDYVLSSQQINRVLRILTILSSMALPFVVLSSLYGMNIYLPGGAEPGSLTTFVILLIIMLGISGSMLYLFKRLRWL